MTFAHLPKMAVETSCLLNNHHLSIGKSDSSIGDQDSSIENRAVFAIDHASASCAVQHFVSKVMIFVSKMMNVVPKHDK